MSSKWHEIWEKRSADEGELSSKDPQRVFLELKRIAGWDSTGDILSYEQFHNQYIEIKNELEFNALHQRRPMKSLYEVGCGCGANLYLFQGDGIEIGGVDYSAAEIEIAGKVLQNPRELVCDEAVNISAEIKYDAVLSNSVFSYFEGYDYAEKVLEIMYRKANYSIGLIDIHDAQKKEAFVECRKAIIEDYEERYRELPKFFYEKTFFLDFAERHDLSIRFSKPDMQGYWNNDYVFNCFMTKNGV